jgi:hypothetical protein
MTLFRPPDPPRWPAPRPVAVVQRLISENAAEQARALEEHRPDMLYELQERQRALFIERRRAEFAERGILPEIIRGAP